MENFLRKIKLIDDFSFELRTTKHEFISALKSNIDEADIDGFFSTAFETFSSSKNLFKGKVSHSGFRIRKRKRFFDRQFALARATGNYRENTDSLLVHGTLNGWSNYMFLFFGIAALFYLIFISAFIFGEMDDPLSFMALPFILIHAAFMFGIPYFAMRSGVKKLKQDIEREFHFIISKSNNLK